MDSDKPKVIYVDDGMPYTRRLVELIKREGLLVREVNTKDFTVLNIKADDFTKPVSFSLGDFDQYFTNVPECEPYAEDNIRGKDNFRPARDWNYLQLRNKRW